MHSRANSDGAWTSDSEKQGGVSTASQTCLSSCLCRCSLYRPLAPPAHAQEADSEGQELPVHVIPDDHG